MSYKCPICSDGIFEIIETRNGPPGFRTTDYDLGLQSCDCDIEKNQINLMAIQSFKEEGYDARCDFCNKEIAVIEYDYYNKDDNGDIEFNETMICTKCFGNIAKKDPSES
ncbi:hypothetical protein IGJ01_001051 [Enterococcus sp. AZ089]|uniref:Uncharacterized protein n=1 Tax=Enterococcus entomosocium TaxID=3034352 RepID=A0ABV3MDM6_9ENTE|nr:hypothetical protein [Enterococcus casseliflavus]MDB1710395.1 hypothetical protein [Enterococcus casseliflavus]MDB1718055.1 hypothetical protein [Enterococcus casseliflavus]